MTSAEKTEYLHETLEGLVDAITRERDPNFILSRTTKIFEAWKHACAVLGELR